ncbi:hypothetical protein V6N13_135006 [Hibiscus sabdariffa]
MGEATEAPGTPSNNLLPFPNNKGQALSTDEMYGPWMIVEEQVTPTVAVIDANAGIHCEQPSWSKTRASSSGGKKVLNVVGDGLRSKGHHKAMSIVEDGAALDGGTRGGLKKGLKGVSNLKLQVRKQSVFKAPNLPLLSEWVNSLSCNVSVEKHSHVPVDSSSTQGDPPDTRSHTNNVHGIGLKVIWVISIWCRLGIWQPHLQCWDRAGSLAFRGHFRRVVRDSKPVLVALYELWISGSRASSVIRKLGFPKSFRVEAHGFSEGIWILWKEELVVQVLRISNHYVHMRVSFSATEPPVFITVVYAKSKCYSRKGLVRRTRVFTTDCLFPFYVVVFFLREFIDQL